MRDGEGGALHLRHDRVERRLHHLVGVRVRVRVRARVRVRVRVRANPRG